ncbi:MAG: hypothetical protein LC754_00525 [Acidobacteria bacterium]|nr:hypothetical protein [Acidobacteriota bacterium]
MTIEDFGARVASVWEGLRPSTRSLVERALLVTQTPSGAFVATPSRAATTYDARSEWELSRLLAALDERAAETGTVILDADQSRELVRLAETCAAVLNQQARSAEVFAQLLERALHARDYTRVDTLADALDSRLAPSETCELARHINPSVRAIAREALLQIPTSVLVSLLSDPVDSEVARDALEHQAVEYGSEEARWIVNALNQADAADEDL